MPLRRALPARIPLAAASLLSLCLLPGCASTGGRAAPWSPGTYRYEATFRVSADTETSERMDRETLSGTIDVAVDGPFGATSSVGFCEPGRRGGANEAFFFCGLSNELVLTVRKSAGTPVVRATGTFDELERRRVCRRGQDCRWTIDRKRRRRTGRVIVTRIDG